MPRIRFTSAQRTEPHRRGDAATADRRRHVTARKKSGGDAALVVVEAEKPDVRCELVDAPLDPEDMTRVLTGFRGRPIPLTPALRYVRASSDGEACAYVFDEITGMVYILD